MAKFLYKYVGPTYIDKVFADRDHICLKCSYPKDFNDPYELFLTIDFDESPEILAFYADAVGELPQLPTTCFSRSPAVIPMWAHYAQNLQGFCIEIDEELLSECFPKSGFGDVDYHDEPKASLKDILYRAYRIGKYRYMYFLHRGVFSAAYYTKASYWSYEEERRMVIKENETRIANDLILIDVPKKCITGLICGPRASKATMLAIREEADRIGCRHFMLKIGKTSARPYFLDLNSDPFIFNGSDIEQSENYCETCKEPISSEEEQCSWCQIDEFHISDAASRNPYRMLDHYGLLGSYIESSIEIEESSRRKDH